ncbi:MAG: hypothetical protein Q9209_002969 [Squamulea sp. 1 TL-2023]
MNAFFTSWYTASVSAAGISADKITEIVNIASPAPEKDTFWATLVVDSLLAGLAFLPGFNVAANAGASAVKNFLSSAVRQAKSLEAPARIILASSASVYGHLFPHDGSAASNLLEAGKLNAFLADLADDLSARLGPALETAVNNVTAFLDMASTGAFTSPYAPKLDEDTKNLEQALTTYVISIALSASTWFVGLARDTTINMLLDGSHGKLNVDYGCTKVEANGFCGSAIWQDSVNNQGLTLIQQESGLNNPYSIYQNFFGGEHPYTTPELLFVGAAKCRTRPGWGQGVSTLLIDGVPNFDCLSQLKVCTWNNDCKLGRTSDNMNCEYLEADCPPEAGYGWNPDRYKGMPSTVAEDYDTFYVAPGYMGPSRTGDLDMELRTTSR